MKICLPVDQLNGLESEIAPNFRAAPALLLIDSDNREFFGIDATSGACGATPLEVDAIVCAGGIGRGMFNGLRSRGVRVFNTDALTVAEALSELASGRLEEVSEVACCGGGSHDSGETHAHAHEGSGCGCSNAQSEAGVGDAGGCCGGGHH